MRAGNRAGPIERAGLTDVPSSGMPTRWIAVSIRPIASPAKPRSRGPSVTSSTTNTSRNVKMTSRRSAPEADARAPVVRAESHRSDR